MNEEPLLGKMVTFIGFGWEPHPILPHHDLQICFYHYLEKGENNYIICLSEIKGKINISFNRKGLGKDVPGDLIADYAQRRIKGVMSYKDFKKIMVQGFTNMKWEWMG